MYRVTCKSKKKNDKNCRYIDNNFFIPLKIYCYEQINMFVIKNNFEYLIRRLQFITLIECFLFNKCPLLGDKNANFDTK